MDLVSKPEMAKIAEALARSYELVTHKSILYMPKHWQTGDLGPCPVEERIWEPMSHRDIRDFGNQVGKILFWSESEMLSFTLMLHQNAIRNLKQGEGLLLRTTVGLKVLDRLGQLVDPEGLFRPNYIRPPLNEDATDKAEVLSIVQEWLAGDDEAASLLHHLATALAPHYSIQRYMMLIGDGANGKSILLGMLDELFNPNVSKITRQAMSVKDTTVLELNDKLLNIIMDGPMEYIKESSTEKTLIAGEEVGIRPHYQNSNIPVRTNALFIEGLNQEPKTRDKTYGLQRRLVRFWFPQTYPINHQFKRRMLSEPMLGALLALMIDHFVPESGQLAALTPTQSSQQMAIAHELDNSPAMQFVQALVVDDPSWLDKLEQGGLLLEDVAGYMVTWATGEGMDYISLTEAQSQLRKVFNSKRKSIRSGQAITKVWILQSPMPAMQALLDLLKETP